MDIRRIRENDFEDLLSLYGHLHESDIEGTRETLLNVWNSIFRNRDIFLYFVGEMEGKIIASCNLTIIPNLTRGGSSIGLIENVVTHRDFRKQGFGKMIIEHAIQVADENNCYKVMLMSNARRKEAHMFYEKLGFSSRIKWGM